MLSTSVDTYELDVSGRDGPSPIESLLLTTTTVERLVLRDLDTNAMTALRTAMRALPRLSEVEWHGSASIGAENTDGEVLAEALCDRPSLRILTPTPVFFFLLFFYPSDTTVHTVHLLPSSVEHTRPRCWPFALTSLRLHVPGVDRDWSFLTSMPALQYLQLDVTDDDDAAILRWDPTPQLRGLDCLQDCAIVLDHPLRHPYNRLHPYMFLLTYAAVHSRWYADVVNSLVNPPHPALRRLRVDVTDDIRDIDDLPLWGWDAHHPLSNGASIRT